MKFRLPPHAFPPLVLTAEEQRWLRDEAQAVIAETIRAQKQYVAADGRPAFTKKDWKQVRARDDFAVYKERRTKRPSPTQLADAGKSGSGANVSSASTPDRAQSDSVHNDVADNRHYSVDSLSSEDNTLAQTARSVSTASGAWTSSSVEDDSIVASMKEPHVPMLMAMGTLGGPVDDIVFGALAGDEITWRLRSAYAKDKFADARFLAKIDGASPSDPFRSLCVKWFTKELPALVGSFIQRRDFVILEGTGSGVDVDGVPYRYYFLHSVQLAGAPELTGLDVIRCKVSLCFVCRPLSGNLSQLFARGFSDPRGEMIESVGVTLTAESIIAATLVIECAHVKKIMWFMQKKLRQRQQKLQQALSSAMPPSECESCHRSTKKLGRTTHLAPCQACGHSICVKCSVQKRIIIDISGDGVLDRPLTFCFGCVMEANRLSSWDVATDALMRADNCYPKPSPHAHHMPPPVPVLPRSQSLGVEETRRTMYAARDPNIVERATTVVRPHSSKSVAGIVLY